MKLVRAFAFAFQGLRHFLATQSNARIHLLAATAVFLLAWWLSVSRTEWLILILTCTLVFACEALNTAIEFAVDLASPQIHPLAKNAKDVAAAAVLIAAIGAVIVAWVIFIPYLRERLGH